VSTTIAPLDHDIERIHNPACVFSLDDGYVLPFKVFFSSLLKTHSLPSGVPVFILHTDDLSNASKSTITEFCSRYSQSPTFLNAESLIPPNLPIPEGTKYTAATYYRLFIADILPSEITHVVYLDVDMVVINCIADLFGTTYPTPIAAVDHLSPYQSVRLWGESGGSYFQAGVMLASLNTWRLKDMSSEFLSIINDHMDRLGCVDQDVLNIAFKDNWTPLPIGYNIEEGALRSLSPQWLDEHIKIAHFSGLKKPWNSYNSSPYTSFWDQAYEDAFGVPFNREQLKPPVSLRSKAKTLIKSTLKYIPSF
jgi:lipopolysaccharide biosynthesis glycosyltransferase